MEGVDQSWEVAQGAHAVSHPDGCPGSTSVSAAACVPRAGVQLGGGGANSAHPPVPPPLPPPWLLFQEASPGSEALRGAGNSSLARGWGVPSRDSVSGGGE